MNEQIDYGTYRTSEIARYYGMTNKGLEFYEDKGILNPRREENGKYRVFHLEDCYTIYAAKLLRRCGFTVEETVQLVNRPDEQEYREKLLERKADMEKGAKILERLAFHSNEICALLKNLDERTAHFELRMRPAMVRLYVRTYTSPHKCSIEEAEEFALWNSYLPVNRASLLFPREMAISGTKVIDTDIGNIMLETDYALLEFPKTSRVTFYPPQKCVYTVICGNHEDMSDANWLKGSMHYLKSNGLKLSGDIVTQYIGIFDRPGGARRFDEAWLPV